MTTILRETISGAQVLPPVSDEQQKAPSYAYVQACRADERRKAPAYQRLAAGTRVEAVPELITA